jgi:hypothetical protein
MPPAKKVNLKDEKIGLFPLKIVTLGQEINEA